MANTNNNKKRAWLAALGGGALLMGAAWLARADDFDAAADAWRHGNMARLNAVAPRLGGHPLYPYVAFWRLAGDINHAEAADVDAFFARYPDSLLAARLRGMWLKRLAREGRWPLFQQYDADLQSPDGELECARAEAALVAARPDAVGRARTLWLTGAETSPGCLSLFDRLSPHLTEADRWARVERHLDQGQWAQARLLAGRYLPDAGKGLADLEKVVDHPRSYLNGMDARLSGKVGRELALVAFARLYPYDPLAVFRRWSEVRNKFDAMEQARMWAQMALLASRRFDPSALDWFGRGEQAMTDLHQEWRARLALRQGDWALVERSIGQMSARDAAQPNWRYWLARARQARGDAQGADALLRPLAETSTFYGILAAGALGQPAWQPAPAAAPTQAELDEAGRLPAWRLAAGLMRHGMRVEALRQILFASRALTDRQLLAVAALARDQNWYDLSIAAAEKTRQAHDFSLRYPLPFRKAVERASAEHGIDAAWIFGLMRQESRFVTGAQSGVHAQGLMQLMPATAGWVARQLGERLRVSDLSPDGNVRFGSYYLSYIARRSGSPVLATAAYNAGLSRAREWQGPLPLEAAVYIESIPFAETRDYVQKVMANACYYGLRLAHPLPPLRDYLGTVAARGG